MWTYNGTVPGPVWRVRQGVPFQAVVENGLAEDTTVHWHGIRLPNAMDGVPGLTQLPIRPGGQFTYAFTPQDAGTFWYHPHANGLEQIGRGLAGVLIVEEAEPPPFDRPWLEALGVGSAVLSLLPCAAMCAAGLCMKGGGGCANQGGLDGSAEADVSPAPRILTST